MGKVKEKLPTPDTNPVDGDKLIEATKPKNVKKSEEKPKKVKPEVDLDELQSDLDNIGNWVADIDEELREISKLVLKMANRMGFK